jgi:class 3 adenylate cyclase
MPLGHSLESKARASRLASLSNANIVTLSPLVHKEDVEAWSNFSFATGPAMYSDSIEFEDITTTTTQRLMDVFSRNIFGFDFATLATYNSEEGDGPFLPVWQSFPLLPIRVPSTNLDILSLERHKINFLSSAATKLPSIEFANNIVGNFSSGEFEFVLNIQLFEPIFEQIYNGKRDKSELKMVGMVLISLDWSSFFKGLLPEGVKGTTLVLSSSCSPDVFTYEINGAEVVPMGPGDLHDPTYDDMKVTVPFVSFEYDESSIPDDICISELRLSLYPTEEFEESFYTNEAIYFTVGVIAIFASTSLVFCIYDVSVRRRQSKVMARVIRQDKIVSNMFPTAIRDRLYANKRQQDGDNNNSRGDPEGLDIDDDLDGGEMFGGAPLAELYPNVTVVFADIAGFTAWSSTREPSQVFTLLESIYSAFDKIAYRHSVFKVETVGDCYLAVGGLPEYREDHALIVAKFARDCLHKMSELTRKLEVTLGPDTTDLGLRVGLHSGQVTAGVLRGERSRFQLFGDTVNTASRMESMGVQGAIQVSCNTAEELKKWKRAKWIQPRNDTVAVKGKGEMQTYWLETKEQSISRRSKQRGAGNANFRQNNVMAPLLESNMDELEEAEDEEEELDDISDDDGTTLNTMTKTQRLVAWHVEVLSKLLQQILAARDESRTEQDGEKTPELVAKVEEDFKNRATNDGSTTVLDEFEEIITMPIVTADDLNKRKEPDSVVLPVAAVSQLHDFISFVAEMYRANPFHNFEHASHVTASVRKLLTRIVDADHTDEDQSPELLDLAGHSYGITSDPLTQFAVVFSAIIHDADHPGVPNTQLVKENTRTAQIYKKSIAEQN